VIDTSPIDYGKVKAMVLSHHVVWDVFEPTQAWVTQGIKDDLLEPLDYKVIPTDGVAPYYVTNYAVANAVYAMAITCRTDAYPNGAMPQSWAEFWDTKKFPGPRTLPKQPQQTLEIALMADGVSPSKLYPLDVDRSLKSLDKIRGSVPTWYDNASTATQLLVDKEVKCAALYHNRVWAMQKDGVPVKYIVNQAVLEYAFWSIPRGAPNNANAQKLIAYWFRPQVQAAFAKMIGAAPVSTKAFAYLDPATASKLPTAPQYKNQVVIESQAYWGPNYSKVLEQFNQWLLK
jgi:putative spermidine/putrescine transport system substrate-binding protein